MKIITNDRAFSVIALIALLLCTYSMLGQVRNKKQLTPADYDLWGTMQLQGISGGGNWVSFKMEYQNGHDTLFVKNINAQNHYAFPGALSGSFCGDKQFAAYYQSGDLKVTTLATGKAVTIPKVSEYSFSYQGKFLVTLERNADLSDLKIYQGNSLVKAITGVSGMAWNTEKNTLAYTLGSNGENSLNLLFLSDHCSSRELIRGHHAFAQVKWSEDGTGIVFYTTGQGDSFSDISYYSLRRQKIYTLTANSPEFPVGMVLYSGYAMQARISNDGERIFFGITETVANKDGADKKKMVEVWNGNDKWLYPLKQQINGWTGHPKLSVWMPEKHIFRQISSAEYPWVTLTGDQQHALVADPGSYLPHYTLNGIMDYHIVDLTTGARKLMARGVSAETMNTAVSEDGKYIAYYLDSNWWIYNIARDTHRNLTQALGPVWDQTDSDPANAPAVYGVAGFTGDAKNIVIYDAYDLWQFPLSGGKPVRLTKGRENNTRFTIDESDLHRYAPNYSGRAAVSLDLSKPMILKASNFFNSAQGYYHWTPEHGVKALAYGTTCIDRAIRSENGNAIAYVEQDYTMPPRIMVNKGEEGILVYQSNKQHWEYNWGTTKMIQYKNNGKSLNAAVFFPPQYKAGRSYPTIVYIYERVTQYIHQYVNPTLENAAGFNIANLTAQGYVVMLPDIEYTAGNPGNSALECVSSATQCLIEKGIAEPGKIGLTGHSFGGYQTNYIITHSHLFAAAVSGSGVSDIVSAYFTYGKMIGSADMWRYESQQFRMGKPFYSAAKAYCLNSPILAAENTTTPVLLWTGDADRVVSPTQTMELYLALRRLGKKCIMLSYPEMGHNPTDAGQMADLTLKLEDWFSHYLRARNIAWIQDGTK